MRAIGISLLSGAHLSLVGRVMALLKERGATDIVVFLGGIIPAEDIPALKEMGVAEVFGPGTPAATIVETLKRHLASPADAA